MDSESVIEVKSIDEYKDERSRIDNEDQCYFPVPTFRSRGRLYVDSALLRFMLEKQARIVCHHHTLANLGLSTKEATGNKNRIFYLNCSLNRGGSAQSPHPEECDFRGTVSMRSDFIWRFGTLSHQVGMLAPAVTDKKRTAAVVDCSEDDLIKDSESAQMHTCKKCKDTREMMDYMIKQYFKT